MGGEQCDDLFGAAAVGVAGVLARVFPLLGERGDGFGPRRGLLPGALPVRGGQVVDDEREQMPVERPVVAGQFAV